ncbi:MAG TPA: hypothetical protein VFM25_06460 [Verrucomicrobiae bacterium]|nr:hypothetical protein [Verrucomicrobiae bacterium]
MKNILIAVLLAAAVALGVVCAHQRNQLEKQRAETTAIQARLSSAEQQLKAREEADEKAAFAEQKAKILQQTLSQTSAEAAKQSQQVAQLKESLASVKTNSESGINFTKFLKDPKMRDLIKSQQKVVLGPTVARMYNPFFQQVNLTPEQSDQLKDLLEKKMMAASDAGLSMLGGDVDAAKRDELGQQIKEQNDAYDAQIKDLLGDENYQEFQTYEKSAQDRVAISQFSDQLAGTSTPLTSDQEQQLAQVLSDERAGFHWTTDYNNQKPGEMDYAEMFSQDRLDQYAKEKKQFDEEYLNRAKQILSPDQFKALEAFQKNQTELQIMGMKMAGQMFGK